MSYPPAIAAFMRELIRQVDWLDMASERDSDAETLVGCGGPPRGKWPHGMSWNYKVGDGGSCVGWASDRPNNSRIWTRADFRRVAMRKRVKEWWQADAAERSSWSPTVEERETRSRCETIAAWLPSIDKWRADALTESHAQYPAIVPLIVAATKVHNKVIGVYVTEQWNKLDLANKRHERAIRKINEYLPEPVPADELHYFGRRAAAPIAPKKRTFLVSLDPPQITLDGTAYALTPDGAMFMDILASADGEWVSGTDGFPNIPRPDRVNKSLPDAVQEIVESARSKGYRIPRNIAGVITP